MRTAPSTVYAYLLLFHNHCDEVSTSFTTDVDRSQPFSPEDRVTFLSAHNPRQIAASAIVHAEPAEASATLAALSWPRIPTPPLVDTQGPQWHYSSPVVVFLSDAAHGNEDTNRSGDSRGGGSRLVRTATPSGSSTSSVPRRSPTSTVRAPRSRPHSVMVPSNKQWTNLMKPSACPRPSTSIPPPRREKLH